MATNKARDNASDGSDWHDTSPIQTSERDRARQENVARARLAAGASEGRLPKGGTGLASSTAVVRDTDLIAQVMIAAITDGSGLVDVDQADITAALNLFAPVRNELDKLETRIMMLARRQGMSWRVIAEALGLLSPQAAAQRWERMTGATAPAVGALRRRVTSALLDAGVTRAAARVFVGGDEGRTVILQLSANGPAEVRRNVAERIIAALRRAGLDLTDEGSHSIGDMTAYLADGGTAEVFEPAGHPAPST
jgi:hypothetical protein